MKIQRGRAILFRFLVALSAFCHAQPALWAAAPGDEHWDNQFGPVGANGTLYSVVVRSNTVFVGGLQTAVGNTKASSIAGYDGTNWFALNNGVLGDINFTYVFALAQDRNYLYAGGIFTNADNSGAKYIARWDGTNWSTLGSLPAYVFALKFIG